MSNPSNPIFVPQEQNQEQNPIKNAESALARLKQTRLFILDMDGTVYLGERAFPQAINFVLQAKKRGIKVVYFTNNSSKRPDTYIKKLARMGFEPNEGDVITSGDVTADYLAAHHSGERVFLLGTPELESAFSARGIELSEDADIVVTAFDTTLTYKKLEIACRLIRGGASFFSTHPDLNCPVENGSIPDCGAINALISASTNVPPRYFGKPQGETATYISSRFGFPPEQCAIFGDRLYTDIALGKNNGILSVLVLTGESKIEDVTLENRPDLVFGEIFETIQYL